MCENLSRFVAFLLSVGFRNQNVDLFAAHSLRAGGALSASASSKRAKIWDEERGAAEGVDRGADALEEGRAP